MAEIVLKKSQRHYFLLLRKGHTATDWIQCTVVGLRCPHEEFDNGSVPLHPHVSIEPGHTADMINCCPQRETLWLHRVAVVGFI